jgi:hypothetical protein
MSLLLFFIWDLKKRCALPLPPIFFQLIEQKQNIVNSTREDRFNTFDNESTQFLFVKKKHKHK